MPSPRLYRTPRSSRVIIRTVQTPAPLLHCLNSYFDVSISDKAKSECVENDNPTEKQTVRLRLYDTDVVRQSPLDPISNILKTFKIGLVQSISEMPVIRTGFGRFPRFESEPQH